MAKKLAEKKAAKLAQKKAAKLAQKKAAKLAQKVADQKAAKLTDKKKAAKLTTPMDMPIETDVIISNKRPLPSAAPEVVYACCSFTHCVSYAQEPTPQKKSKTDPPISGEYLFR